MTWLMHDSTEEEHLDRFAINQLHESFDSTKLKCNYTCNIVCCCIYKWHILPQFRKKYSEKKIVFQKYIIVLNENGKSVYFQLTSSHWRRGTHGYRDCRYYNLQTMSSLSAKWYIIIICVMKIYTIYTSTLHVGW